MFNTVSYGEHQTARRERERERELSHSERTNSEQTHIDSKSLSLFFKPANELGALVSVGKRVERASSGHSKMASLQISTRALEGRERTYPQWFPMALGPRASTPPGRTTPMHVPRLKSSIKVLKGMLFVCLPVSARHTEPKDERSDASCRCLIVLRSTARWSVEMCRDLKRCHCAPHCELHTMNLIAQRSFYSTNAHFRAYQSIHIGDAERMSAMWRY